MEVHVSQITRHDNEPSARVESASKLTELLGDSEEFALLRETLWIYSQLAE